MRVIKGQPIRAIIIGINETLDILFLVTKIPFEENNEKETEIERLTQK